MINALRSGTAALALLMAMPALAQETSEDSESGVVRLGTIFLEVFGIADDDANSVVASELWVGGKVATSILDTPASVSVITEKEIKLRDAATTEEVLQYSAGIHTDYYGTDDRNDYFLIRGFQATTYRDGLTLGSMRGVREEPLAYERVEVLRGANSALFGVADPGGSVNFVTRQPKFERIADTSLSFGSFGRKEVTFDFGNEIPGASNLAFRITGKVKDSELEYANSQDDSTFLMAGVTWRPSDFTSLSLILDHLDRSGTPNSGGYPLDREYDRSEFFGEPDFNYHEVERSSATVLLTHDFGGGLSLRGNLRYSDLTDDFGYIYLYDYAGRAGTSLARYYFGGDSSAEELIGNVIVQYDTTFGNVASSTLAGVEFRDATSKSASFYGLAAPIDLANPVYSGAPGSVSYYSGSQSDYTTKSLFVTQNLSFNERLIASFGLRRDFLDVTSTDLFTSAVSSGDFAETSGRAALTYKVTDEISVYASYVESVAPPSIGVEPERGEQYEIGAKYAPSGSNALFSAALYDLSKQNVTIAVVQPDGTITRETIGESRVRGFDFEARVEVNDRLSVIGSYSYMDSEIVRGVVRGAVMDGKAFTTAPNHIASVWANYTLADAVPQGDVTLGLGLRYVGSYFFDAANTRKSDDALLVDASLAMDLSDTASLQLSVSNLLDEQHVVGSGTADYYNPGREIGLTLRKSW
ncbi:TonB-dependent siderophore receptor [Pseudogemmobacter sonorensis]|uniref:TonB-dependent siderophore receptor n=1 Tax=Pseudogemmobacter sonorensis TaxID=2989681 RepID=UPI003684773E